MENKHQLVITIINKGFSKMVMDAARGAGATGGTVLGGLGTGNQLEKLMGLNIDNEKDIVLIVASFETAPAIIKAIKADAGSESKAQGITFSLPVDDFTMLSNMLSSSNNNDK